MLTSKQAKFVASYQLTHDATESAKNAGYSAKNAAPQGCRLMKDPEILAELSQWRAKKGQELSKPDFIDMAMEDYRNVEVKEPNRPRFLEIVGKTLGHLGSGIDSRPQQSVTLNQININAIESSASSADLWSLTRKLLSDI